MSPCPNVSATGSMTNKKFLVFNKPCNVTQDISYYYYFNKYLKKKKN